jgi:hypothetical protein
VVTGEKAITWAKTKRDKMLPFQIQMGKTAKKTSPNHPPKSHQEKKQTHTTHLTNLFISQLPQTAKNNTYSKTCHPTNNRFIAKCRLGLSNWMAPIANFHETVSPLPTRTPFPNLQDYHTQALMTANRVLQSLHRHSHLLTQMIPRTTTPWTNSQVPSTTETPIQHHHPTEAT